VNTNVEQLVPAAEPLSTDPVQLAAENHRRHGWDVGPHFLARLSILRVEQLIRRANESRLRPHRLTHARHEALALLAFTRQRQLPLGKMSERLLVHPTSITSTVDALERLGYVERTPHPTDRRTVLARITDEGQAVIHETCGQLTGDRLTPLTDAQALRIHRSLTKVRSEAGDVLDTGAASSGRVGRDPVMAAAENWRRHGWDVGPHFLASLSILRVEQIIRNQNEVRFKPYRLTHARHEALALLFFSRHGQLPLGKLSERLLVHPTSVTSTVDALERLGYVERAAHPEDRRAVLARVTPEGRAAIEATCSASADSRLEPLTDDQAKRLYAGLRKIAASTHADA
jgi:DNA-binding MarR family transcriptional regulator